MAAETQLLSETLYNSAVSAVVSCFQDVKKDLRILPENVQFDVYYKLYEQGRLCQLAVEFCDLDVFSRILKVVSKRHLLHRCFQALMDHGTKVSRELAAIYSRRCFTSSNDLHSRDRLIHLGLRLGSFLSDAGWYEESERVLKNCLELCRTTDDAEHWRMTLDCCHRLLHVQNVFCHFAQAQDTFQVAEKTIQNLQQMGDLPNLASLYSMYSGLYFYKSHYDEAYKWSVKALVELNSSLPSRIIVEVLREAAKSCVVKREFRKAELLIKQAVYLAREVFGERHPLYANTLQDYGFYLLNVDSIHHSVQVYQTALNIQQEVFGGKNLHVAMSHEDLAYALYVYEYSSGRFNFAREHAEKALSIMRHLVPEDHLLLASSKRVKALILEEIAIDSHGIDSVEWRSLLQDAHDLHLAALTLVTKNFGEMNVQTAKHYGNMGRLYQSMKRFEEAEAMHLKAISIKEKLLGPEDYEVALSVGHLASLYNYDMMQYKKAELLYLRSIAIGRKLFGETYSGLEYDYRGLLQVYSKEESLEKVLKYTLILNQWKMLREQNAQLDMPPLNPTGQPQPIQDVIDKFFNMD